MHETHFQNSSWYLALGLTERARFLATDEPVAVTEAARRRLERWKSQRPFAGGDWLGRRLDGDGLDVATLEKTLSLSAAQLMERAPRPEWLSQIETAFKAANGSTAAAFVAHDDDPAAAFLNLVVPMLEAARTRLSTALARLDERGPMDVARATELLLSAISQRALHAVERALVLELHVAKAEGRLSGESPAERFAHFAQSLAAREQAASLLSMYPVLARRVAQSIDDGVAAAVEFAGRLVGDWPEIRCSFFDGGDPGALIDLDCLAGDPHKRGRSVVIARFASGQRLVYKPRSLDADLHFQETIEFLNARIDAPPFRTLSLLPRDGYGWMEFVETRPCRSQEDVQRYYWRVGGLLALLHALRGVDCHFENMVAHGDQPVLVDLETILHPAIPHREPDRYDRRLSGRVLTQSVLRVGILPVPFGGDDPARAIDLSGVAAVEGAMSPDRVLLWEKRGTDEMRAVREHVEMGGAENRVFLDGHALDAADYHDAIEEGFAHVYRVVARERDALLAPDGPVRRFAHDTVRVVIRATRAYGMLLAESLHPDLLRDALDRDRFFDRLWVGVDQHPALARAVGAEHRDLSRADIPYFTTRPSERHLWTSEGERIDNFFERSSLELVEERIRSMDEADLARQQWMVTLSLGSLAATKDGSDQGAALVVRETVRDVAALDRRLIAEAARIGDRLGEIAVHDGDGAAWVTLEFREQRWLLEPVSNDLYVGLPGVALFLAYLASIERLHKLPGAHAHEALARAAVRTMTRTMGETGLTAVGAYSGWGGILYSLAHVATLWDDDRLCRECDAIVHRIDEVAAHDEDGDLVGGLAGAIAALCAASVVSISALSAAVRAGDLLLARAQKTKSGLWWRTRLAGDQPATGFSHGNAGIGWALCRLGAASYEDRFKQAGLAAIEFEREQHRAGADQATGSEHEEGLVATWCYGAPGIGISRLHARHVASSASARDQLETEVRDAIATTLHHGFGRNHCLCHGDLGNLDFLMLALEDMPGVLDDEGAPLQDRILDLTAWVMASIEANGWLCGTPAHVPSPGIMNGWAGIGYGLLRMAHPMRVPSVLSLEAPFTARRG